MNWKINNLYALDFIHLNEKESLQILQMRNHDNITKYMLVDRKISKKEHFRFIESLKNQSSKAFFAIKDSSDSEFLGVVSLTNIDLCNKNAFLGIYANPMKRKVGAKLIESIAHIAFVEFGLHILFAKVLETNTRALAFYNRQGFTKCGILPEAVWRDSTFINIILLSLKNKG